MTTETIETQSCVHHYLVEPAAGPTSLGTCKHCANQRTFTNIAVGYDDDATVRQGTKRLYNHRGADHRNWWQQTYRVDEEDE